MIRMNKPARAIVLAGGVALLVSGCATRQQPLYYWGSYQSDLYTHFKGEKGPEDQILALEATRQSAAARGLPVPPGFNAHLAMQYGRAGQSDKLLTYLESEKLQYPESGPFMDFLLKKFEKQTP